VQLFSELDRRLRKQQENIMTSFKVVGLALLSATASTPAKRRGDSPDGARPIPNREFDEEGVCAMASLYSTNAAASSDRHGSIRSEDGLLDLKLARPCVLCGRDDATNPEQLFAGGWTSWQNRSPKGSNGRTAWKAAWKPERARSSN
jgi:hypothetical protein